MCGEAVPQYVRCQIVPDPDLLAVILQQLPKSLTSHRAATVREKQKSAVARRSRRFSSALQVSFYRPHGALSDRYQSLLPTLPDDPQESHIEIHSALDRAEFGNPEACRVQQLKHRPIAQAIWLRFVRSPQQSVNLFQRQNLGSVFHCRGITKACVGSAVDPIFLKQEGIEVA